MKPLKVVIDGYLTEKKLAQALREIVGASWGGSQLTVPGSKRRWDMWFRDGDRTVVVEYDGDEHYRNTLKIKADNEKDAVARDRGFKVVRVPYWVQLDTVMLKHWFGIDAVIQQDFAHGFISTKIFPASFCAMGIARFERELASLPEPVKAAVIKSLRDRAEEYGGEYVVPAGSLALGLQDPRV